MPKFKVIVERRETYIETLEVEAISLQEAKQDVRHMIDDGEISFEGEAVNSEEYIAAIRRVKPS